MWLLTSVVVNGCFVTLDFSHQMLDLFSIGRTDDQRQLYDKIHITLHDARQLDTEHQQPKLKKARMDYSRPMGVQAGALRSVARFLCRLGVL